MFVETFYFPIGLIRFHNGRTCSKMLCFRSASLGEVGNVLVSWVVDKAKVPSKTVLPPQLAKLKITL